ncbi:MAG: hypothetical protein WD025_06555 [Bacteriovoracaceae bacterium]
MLKSSLSANLFQTFVSTYQKIQHSNAPDIPFVYVDSDGSVKLLTNVIDENDGHDGIFALSMAEDGWMEFLAMQE